MTQTAPEVRQTADDYDVVVIGGAFAGASAALLLRRLLPDSRVLVIERQDQFGRKVGEATVEGSGCFLLRVLGLHDHLAREHLPKHGLRFWFSDGPDRSLAEMSEVGAFDVPGLPSFQLDRSTLDEHLLRLAGEEGAEVARPARVTAVELEWPHSTVRFSGDGGERAVCARWIVDASGRQAFIARHRNLHQRNPDHPTAAIWARWTNVADLDGPAVMGPDPRRPTLPRVTVSRRLGTNHFCGYGWWCWMIPLAGGQTSVGLVYNKDLVQLDGGRTPREKYLDFVTAQPGLRELLAGATIDDDEVLALGHLPYRTTRYMDRGWALVGDAASFMDPYYSPGLDHGAASVYATVRVIEDDLNGRLGEDGLADRIAEHNERFLRSYERWVSALYLDKYEIMGDAELTGCAFLVETSLYYLGIVGSLYDDVEAFRHPAFGLSNLQARVSYRVMRAFNRRLLLLARFRRQVGLYGRRNIGWHSYTRAFGLRRRALGPLINGIRLWLRLEREYFLHRAFNGRVEVSQPIPGNAAGSPSPPSGWRGLG